ncbi:hypothetical protein KC19_1G202800 [Ceratodon purpureus]|uniref:holo-[acyl-carrier-protein] synthase n=1 Tax=Ceratodon purpureus TaxID=3225 RepID=A0A8T0J807_CERPU|nr:hypothetical protein KC19_1G202800 [Ceratodon purpureus]
MRPATMLATAASHHLFRPLPAPSEVHLWCLFPDDVRDSKLMNMYQNLLSSDEQKKILEANNVKTQNERLLARTLVRTTLARYGMVDPSSLRFTTNKFGKPKVIWPSQVEGNNSWRPNSLCFNLSHTQSLLACAVTIDSEVGIDVEEKDRKLSRNLMALARRRFSPEEADWLSRFEDPTQQQQRFMQLWTLKEAYVKALGTGISETPLKDFSFALKPSFHAQTCLERAVNCTAHSQAESITMEFSRLMASNNKSRIPANRWQFLLLQPSPLHIASVCTQMHQPHSPDDENLEELNKCFRMKMWRTLPLVGDMNLTEGAVALGMSLPAQEVSSSDTKTSLKQY